MSNSCTLFLSHLSINALDRHLTLAIEMTVTRNLFIMSFNRANLSLSCVDHLSHLSFHSVASSLSLSLFLSQAILISPSTMKNIHSLPHHHAILLHTFLASLLFLSALSLRLYFYFASTPHVLFRFSCKLISSSSSSACSTFIKLTELCVCTLINCDKCHMNQ